MIHVFMRVVIGGKTGSREGAWFLILALVVAPLCALMVGTWMGKDMAQAWGALMVLAPAVLAVWATAHGLEKAKDAGWIKPRSMKAADIVAEMDK